MHMFYSINIVSGSGGTQQIKGKRKPTRTPNNVMIYLYIYMDVCHMCFICMYACMSYVLHMYVCMYGICASYVCMHVCHMCIICMYACMSYVLHMYVMCSHTIDHM